MDYAQTELLRQRQALLSLLLRGDLPRETGEGPAEAAPEPLAAQSAGSAPGRTPEARRAGETPKGPEAGVVSAGRETEAPEPGETGPASRRSDGAGGSRSGERPARRREVPPGRTRLASAGGGGAGDLLRPGPAAAGGTDARALSRAVQRDARRYDGGFTIY